MAKRGMAMGATTKANIGAGRKSGLRLSSGGLGTSPFSQAKSAASKAVRKVNSEVKSKIAKAKKKGIAGKPSVPRINKENLDPTPSPDSFRMSKAKALLENTMRAKNRVARRIGFTGDSNLILFARTKGARDKAKRKSRLRQFGEGAGIGAGLHIGSRTAFGAALYGLSSNKARADSIANNILKGNNNKYVKATVNRVVAPVVNRTTALGIGAYRYGKGSIRNKKLLVGTTLVGGLYNLYRNRKNDVNRAD